MVRELDTVVVLETMWDWRQATSGAGYTQGPAFFHINPNNHSGRRLYKLLGKRRFMVTNACRELVSGPDKHGKPDPQWLADNLRSVSFKMLLVCGTVAWKTYLGCDYVRPEAVRVVFMKHPAARTWTREDITNWQRFLAC